MKMSFDDVLQALTGGRCIDAADVQARALQRYIWIAEWHIPGCLSESQNVCLTKRDAIECALSFAEGSDGCAPRGMRADLMRRGMSDKVSPDAYVSMAITTVSRVRLSNYL